MASGRMTKQKRAAIVALFNGMDEVSACEAAGYVRADTAAQRMFHKTPEGDYSDETVRRELARLRRQQEGAQDVSEVSEATPETTLGHIVQNPSLYSSTAVVQAAKALHAIQEEKRQRVEATGSDDAYQAYEAIHALLYGAEPCLPREVWTAKREKQAAKAEELETEWTEFKRKRRRRPGDVNYLE